MQSGTGCDTMRAKVEIGDLVGYSVDTKIEYGIVIDVIGGGYLFEDEYMVEWFNFGRQHLLRNDILRLKRFVKKICKNQSR